MSRLVIHSDDAPERVIFDSDDGEAIAAALAPIGVTFERWAANAPLSDQSDDAEILAAYADEIERLSTAGGYQSVDVVRMTPDHPQREAFREKFLSEHTHDEDEVRFFVEGAAVFYLRGDGKVHRLLCEADDLISVPAGTQHWFDMGPAPRFAAIRLFTTPAGWVAAFTGDPIADRFPRYEPA